MISWRYAGPERAPFDGSGGNRLASWLFAALPPPVTAAAVGKF